MQVELHRGCGVPCDSFAHYLSLKTRFLFWDWLEVSLSPTPCTRPARNQLADSLDRLLASATVSGLQVVRS